VFNPVTAQLENGSAPMPPGQVLHRLFIILCQDFYRPIPLISLYAKLFPGDYFNPNTSPNRTHQVIKRLRQWILKNKLDLAIEEVSGAFRLRLTSNLAIRIPRQPLPLVSIELEVLRFKTLVPNEEFTAREAAAAMLASRSETQRVLQWAVATGEITSHGATNRVRYKKS
jgi:hypothetical protein